MEAKTIKVKLLSGRFILTLVGAAVFFITAIKGILEAQAVSAILSAIFLSYFNRNDRTTTAK